MDVGTFSSGHDQSPESADAAPKGGADGQRMARVVSPEIDDARARIEEDIGQQEESDHGGRPEEHDGDGLAISTAGRDSGAMRFCAISRSFFGSFDPFRRPQGRLAGKGAARRRHRSRAQMAQPSRTARSHPCATGWTVVPILLYLFLFIIIILYYLDLYTHLGALLKILYFIFVKVSVSLLANTVHMHVLMDPLKATPYIH
ncbi:hypothetical protein RAA17_24755 [Komagataeibacter rhaeticus]|nr:hypothetical protein [Komagataeibacter rhaeticus]